MTRLADCPDPLAPVALLALGDLADRAGLAPVAADPRGDALTVAQLFLHADVDGDLSHAGQGDTGGIATLLVQLGDALLEAEPPVARVLTLSRGGPADALDGHRYLPIPLWGPKRPAALAWPLRVAAERGIRRILIAAGRVDAVHLRMGDVGSMAAAQVATELGIPIVFTLAPDPNALVAGRDAAGTLTRADFGAADAIEHLVFRERLLRELQARSAHLVLFPRPALQHDMRSLLNLDIEAEEARVSVVAEGISLCVIDRAEPDDRSRAAIASPAFVELDGLLGRLPLGRRGLPLAVSVGRLTRVKGMATLVEAWADGGLGARCHLLVVGGDLTDPTVDEQEQLAAIASVVPLDLAAGRGLRPQRGQRERDSCRRRSAARPRRCCAAAARSAQRFVAEPTRRRARARGPHRPCRPAAGGALTPATPRADSTTTIRLARRVLGEQVAGTVGWHWTRWGPSSGSRNPMIGIWLVTSLRGHGVGTRARRLLVTVRN